MTFRTATRRLLVNLRRLADRPAKHPGIQHVLVALLSFLLGGILMTTAGIPVPAVHDECSYILAADTFAHGRLTNPPHPMADHFETFHVLQHPTYQSKYYPAQGAILALGQVTTGDPFIGVLLVGMIMCGALSYFFFAWLPPRWAVLAGFFALFTFGVNSYWTNTYWGGCLAAAGGAFSFGALRYIHKRTRWRDPLLLALGILLLTTTRLAECVVILPIIAIALAWWFFRNPTPPATRLRRVILPLAVCGIVVLAVNACYNFAVTGNPFTFPYIVHYRQNEIYPPTYFGSLASPPQHVDPVLGKFYFENGIKRFPQPMNLSNLWTAFLEKWDLFRNYFGRNLLLPGNFAVLLLLLPVITLRKRAALAAYLAFIALIALHLVTVYYLPHYSAPTLCLLLVLWIISLRQLAALKFVGTHVARPIIPIYLAAVFATFAFTYGKALATGQRPEDQLQKFSTTSPVRDRPNLEARFQKLLPNRKHLVLVRYHPDHITHIEWVYNGASPDSQNVVWARSLGNGTRDLDIFQYYKDHAVWYFDGDTEKYFLARDAHVDPPQ